MVKISRSAEAPVRTRTTKSPARTRTTKSPVRTRKTKSPARTRTTKSSTSMSTTTHKGRARSDTGQPINDAEKNKNINHTLSSGFASDMSADECDEMQTTPNNVQRSSKVHDFATKTSPNEYQCNICSKVGYYMTCYRSKYHDNILSFLRLYAVVYKRTVISVVIWPMCMVKQY